MKFVDEHMVGRVSITLAEFMAVLLVFCLPSVALAAGVRGSAGGAAPAANHLRLSKADTARLALYIANGEPLMVLAVVARKGKIADVAAAVKKNGGRIDYQHDAIDYLAAVLPTRTLASFLDEQNLEAVAVDNLNRNYADQIQWLSVYNEQEPAAFELGSKADVHDESTRISLTPTLAPHLPPRPLEQPYSILRDMDGEGFRARDARFDGRGVVIAHIEDFPDFLAPELQLAKDATGKSIPKFADIINIPAPAVTLEPAVSRRGERWTTRLGEPVKSRGVLLVHRGRTFRVSKHGTYRLAQLELPSSGWGAHVYPHVREAHVANETLKDGEPLLLDVLWSEADRRLWIDSNGNHDFSDERGVGEYLTWHEFGVLGEDDPSTEIRESAPFAVQAEKDFISINLASSYHATLVAGAAAASRGEGLIDGVAPGAQLVSIGWHSDGGSIAAYARALSTAYMDPRVDVVMVQGYSVVNEPEPSKDGHSVLAILQSRLVEHYRKPTLATANNMPWMSAVYDATTPDNVISVGASHSGASLFAYYGLKSRHAQDLHWVGSEGPSGDGALKPDILSPANPLSVSSRDRWVEWMSLYPGVFRLPIGYVICGGTSCATPVAAGAAALLVGAAKFKGVAHDADAVHEALRNTASHLSHVPAYKQGHGILQLDAAWRYMEARPERVQYDIEVTAPVRTTLSAALPRPHMGRGLFEREGWRAGEHQERVIMLTRRAGPKEPVSFAINWRGDREVFTSADRITLPLNEAVPLKLRIVADMPGAYSAIGRLLDPIGEIAGTVPVTIVVPHEFTAPQAYSWNGAIMLGRPSGRNNQFFRVPEGAKAFSVSMNSAQTGIQLNLVPPHDADVFPSTATTINLPGTSEVTVEDPVPGVWEVVLFELRAITAFDWSVADLDYLPSTPIELTAKVLAASAAVEQQLIRTKNNLAPFNGGVTNMALGGMRSAQISLQAFDSKVYNLDVEPGQELLVAEIAGVDGTDLDADLHLFDCTRGTCVMSRRSNKPGSHERVVAERPVPGKWKLVIVPSDTRKGTAELSYIDYYTHPKFGSLSTTDVSQVREAGTTWDVQSNIWRADEARQDYAPVGVIRVTDQSLRLRQMQANGTLYSSPVGRPAYLELKPFLLD